MDVKHGLITQFEKPLDKKRQYLVDLGNVINHKLDAKLNEEILDVPEIRTLFRGKNLPLL